MTPAPNVATAAARAHLAAYTTAKKHQLQLDRSLGLLYCSDNGALVATVYDNRRPGPDTALDRMVAEHGLRGIEALRTMPPPTRRQWRRSTNVDA
ncbi:MAG: hypothetical protein QOJ06_125 [Pseudonocardiales bacterium]|jgi:hypothetical protein|nr:hypothetical protein [Pseudonocardiales bacterium]